MEFKNDLGKPWRYEEGDFTVVRTSMWSPPGCHPVGCGLKIYVNKDGVIDHVEGDENNPITKGRLCARCIALKDYVYNPSRVIYPMKRDPQFRGQHDKWERITWDEAFAIVKEKRDYFRDTYGPECMAVFSGTGRSGGILVSDMAQAVLGTPNACYTQSGYACYQPRSMSCSHVLGAYYPEMDYAGGLEGTYDNPAYQVPGVMVMWGKMPLASNGDGLWGHAVIDLMKRGAKLISVDPRVNWLATRAEVHLRVRPGTDTKLLLSWFRYIFENKLYDEEFTKYWTNLPFLIDPDTKLPVRAQELFPDFQQTTPENTPAYVCFDLKTNAVAPFEYSAPADSAVDPEIFWAGEFNGKQYKTAGQIYKEEADPWTLEKTAEECWLQADKIEEAIKLYVENNGGIANGVASDMTESASQVPLGCMGLDSIMGRINKPGVTMTQKGGGYFATMTDTGETKLVRPVTYNNGFGGMFSDMYGVGAVIGMSDAENEARIKQLGEAMPDSQRILNKLLQDRLGMKDHKGLYAWCHSHIPTVRNAIATGEPFKPRVWFDMSGNKLAMLGNAKSWYDVFPEVDYIIGQYPMLTSFHIEACDLVFPLREWLEEPMVNMTQLDTQWLQNECVHIGETVSHSIPAAQVVAKCREMWGGHIPNGLELGDGTAYLGSATEAEVKQGVADTLGAPDWETLQANTDEYVPFVTPDYWNYNQHEQIADDGLPSGFATESRKVETYCQMLIRMARNGYPYCYPEPQEACEDYSPICVPIEPVESPYEGMPGYDPEYPFVLTSGRVPYFHHGTMRHAPFSRELFPCAEIRINPASAKELGIEHMDWVKVTSRRGEVHARAYLTEGVNPKTVWMERFWNPECYDASQANPTGGWRECNVNVLTKNDAPFNEVYGSYTNRGFTVKIEKSERPANIWVEAEEFEPFMPTQEMLAEAQTKDVF